jgi:IS5 family transposase
MKQMYLFAEETQLEMLSKLGDNLEKLSKLIDFEIFRNPLAAKLVKENPKGGRPRKDVVMMFKIVILQALHGDMSNDATEFTITDRGSWQRFLGLCRGEKSPDANTIWQFKEDLGSETMQEMLEIFNKMLFDEGYITGKGVMADATFNEVPKRRAATREENKSLKDGEIPDSLKPVEKPEDRELTAEEKAHNHKISQIDTDATWAKKGEETHFGYKNHVAVDEESKLITNVVVTTASVHDVNIFVHLVCLAFSAIVTAGLDLELLIVYADSGYTGSKYAEMLRKMWDNCIVHVIKKAFKNHPLKGWEKSYNRSVSSKRCRVEHVFGTMTNDMGGIHTRTIGLERNTRDIVAKSLAYNIKRAAFLFSQKAKTRAA